MTFKELKNYEEMVDFVKSHENVIVSVRPKGGCPICEIYAPHFKNAMERVMGRRKDFEVVILYIDEECIEHLDVCSPTVLFYKNGEEKKRIIVEKVPVEDFEKVLEDSIEEIFK